MRGRGKALETYRRDLNNLYSSASGLPCKKHPSSSPVGVCALCLKDRLLKLVCSEIEVGSVGRISFLIENEKPIVDRSEDGAVLKRSNSTCVESKRSGGFWKIGRLFRRNRERSSVAGECDDEKSEMWLVDYRSSSLSRTSGFSEAEPRKSGISETEPRKSTSAPNVLNRRIKESSDSGFIDLKFDFKMGGGNMSCRRDGGIKRSFNFKGWGWMWIFKNHPNSTR